MATIHPFPGLRYNPELKPNLESVISPPYDKVSNDDRKRLWERDEHNVVKLILPPPSDVDVDVATHSMDAVSAEWYGEAAQRLRAWRDEGVLKQDEPCFYIYSQTYKVRNRKYTRTGIFAALELEDDAGPKAHEHTFEGPKADRLRLTRAAKANLSPIFLLADGDKKTWQDVFDSAKTVLADFTDDEGQAHLLRAISGKKAIEKTKKALKACDLVIADGHHRYETAQNYRREMQEQTGLDPKTQPWGCVMAYIVPLIDSGLQVLPTHRVLSNLPLNWFDALDQQLSSFGELQIVESISPDDARKTLAKDKARKDILIYSQRGIRLFHPDADKMREALRSEPEAIRALNVTALHRLILDRILMIPQDTLVNNTKYIRGEKEAMALVDGGGYEAAFIMAGIPPASVFKVSMEGVRMPQKSTDFYPKAPTGLLIRPMT